MGGGLFVLGTVAAFDLIERQSAVQTRLRDPEVASDVTQRLVPLASDPDNLDDHPAQRGQ